MTMEEVLCNDSDKKLFYDSITRKYFCASVSKFAQFFTVSNLIAANRIGLQRQAAAYASYTELLSAMKRYRKKVEEEQRRERKRIKNRKKRERMKRLRVKKVKR